MPTINNNNPPQWELCGRKMHAMKHFLLLVALIPTFVMAQDVIVKKDGSTILSKVHVQGFVPDFWDNPYRLIGYASWTEKPKN